MSAPRISIVVPFHWMDNWPFFLERCLKSIEKQSYKDYEVVLVKHSIMPVTSNRAIESAKGQIIKVLYMDDYFYDENALQHLIDSWNGQGWAVSGCIHDEVGNTTKPHTPVWSDEVLKGMNHLGSPSVLAFENDGSTKFDERMSWMLDVNLYRNLYYKYGEPKIINHIDVAIGLHEGQVTNLMSDAEKAKEVTLFHENN